MHLVCKNVQPSLTEYKEIKSLLARAFPKEEQYPLWLLRFWALRSDVDFTAYYDGKIFCGVSYTVRNAEAVFVLYLAVNDRLRSKGYGGMILNEIKERNPDKTILLNVEPADETAENREQRIRRIAFYRKNGFYETGCRIADKKSEYEILSTSQEFLKESYRDLLRIFSFGLYAPQVFLRKEWAEKNG